MTRPLLGSRAAGSRAGSGVFEMGTSLDIKIKRANKVYHAGVSGVGGPAGFIVSRAPRTSGWVSLGGAGALRQVHAVRGSGEGVLALTL